MNTDRKTVDVMFITDLDVRHVIYSSLIERADKPKIRTPVTKAGRNTRSILNSVSKGTDRTKMRTPVSNARSILKSASEADESLTNTPHKSSYTRLSRKLLYDHSSPSSNHVSHTSKNCLQSDLSDSTTPTSGTSLIKKISVRKRYLDNFSSKEEYDDNDDGSDYMPSESSLSESEDNSDDDNDLSSDKNDKEYDNHKGDTDNNTDHDELRQNPVVLLKKLKISRFNEDISRSGEKLDNYLGHNEDISRCDEKSDNYASSKTILKKQKFQSEYYFLKKFEKNKTSNNTLSKLKAPKLSQNELNDLLSVVEHNHYEQKQDLLNKYKLRFTRWLFYLREGFSLLLYGFGSKRDLLTAFQTECLSSSRVLVINGFFPGLTMKEVLDSLASDILKLKTNVSDSVQLLKLINSKVKNADKSPIFIILHNIDGIALRLRKHQSILAKLASMPNIHLITSIDHINAPLLWGNSLLALFNFLWLHVPTFQMYRVETGFETSFTHNSSSATTMSSLLHVFSSLPSTTQKIFQLIIKDHIDNNANKSYRGVSFGDLYSWSRAAMLVTSDLALRTQLTEFVDHQIIKWRSDSDHIIIPISVSILAQFYENNFSDDDF